MLRTASKPSPCDCGNTCRVCRDPHVQWINRLDWSDSPDEWRALDVKPDVAHHQPAGMTAGPNVDRFDTFDQDMDEAVRRIRGGGEPRA